MEQVESIGSPGLWAGFVVLVLVLLSVDLLVLGRRQREMTFREALGWTGVWVGVAALVGLFVYVQFGGQRALEFTTGYLIEEALSVDNLFVFIVLFQFFRVPPELQRRVLFWGILGALVMRGLFILVGAALLHRFHFLIYVFGGFLIVTGAKLLFKGDEEMDPSKNLALRAVRRLMPVTDRMEGARFFVVRQGRRMATPLFVVLVVVEATDLVFAVDSIPAIFAVTTDPFVVYTSNICAILGLRSLYFLLSKAMTQFRYLNVGLAVVLMFVGAKMAVSGFFHIPIGVSLGVVAGLLFGAVLASLAADRRDARRGLEGSVPKVQEPPRAAPPG
jgi:tellurite resistance protein TerC